MEFIAHRAGNRIESARAAAAIADLVELDVHLGPDGGIEVRHAKRIWLTDRLWERWYLLASDSPRLELSALLAAIDESTPLWIDLKGVSPRLASSVRSAIARRPHVTVSSKSWWLLGTFAEAPATRTVRSAGNRTELLLMLLRPSKVDGAVVHRRLLSRRVISILRRRGRVFTWAVDSVDDIVALHRSNIDGVIVDDLGLIEPARQIVAGDRLRDQP
jgi:hypothetical protein